MDGKRLSLTKVAVWYHDAVNSIMLSNCNLTPFSALVSSDIACATSRSKASCFKPFKIKNKRVLLIIIVGLSN
jgi:hypothetical protein